MFKVFVLLLLSSLSVLIVHGQTNTFGSRCASRLHNWVDSTDTWNHSPNNWSPPRIPDKTSFVRLHTDTTGNIPYNVTVTSDVWISSLDIGNNVYLDILPQVYMLLADYELNCWEVLWCHNQGTCVELNECQCDPGWTGESCDISTSICPNPGQTRDACGICGGDGTYCICQDYIETPVEEVARLLFLYNNDQITAAIDDILNLLSYVKWLASFYDPNTQRLTPEIKIWILYFQNFCNVCLDTFYQQNWEFLSTIQNTPVLQDPCDTILVL